MAKTKQNGLSCPARCKRSLFSLAALGLVATVVTGCSNTPTNTPANNDPLTGPLIPPGNPPPASTSVSTPVPQASAQPGLPTIPASLSASNTASIAGTSWQNPGSLAIRDNSQTGPKPVIGQAANDRRTLQTPVSMPGYPATPVPKVEPVPDAVPGNVTPTGAWQAPASQPGAVQTANAPPIAPATNVPAPFTATTSAPAALPPSANIDPLKKQLQDRGVINQTLDNVPEGVHLTCYVSRGAGLFPRIYEVTAADYATAVQSILQQLP
jgi:hypothetical protein